MTEITHISTYNPELTPWINPYQAEALSCYADGDYSYFLDPEEVEFKHEDDFLEYVEELGDTLLLFILRELATREGTGSYEEAIRRMYVASGDIDLVIGALERART